MYVDAAYVGVYTHAHAIRLVAQQPPPPPLPQQLLLPTRKLLM